MAAALALSENFLVSLRSMRLRCRFGSPVTWNLPSLLLHCRLFVTGANYRCLFDLVICLIWGVSLSPSNLVRRLLLFCFVCFYYFLMLSLGSGESTICSVLVNNGDFRYSLMLV